MVMQGSGDSLFIDAQLKRDLIWFIIMAIIMVVLLCQIRAVTCLVEVLQHIVQDLSGGQIRMQQEK